MCRTELPSIFPWSTTTKNRREIIKHDIPVKRRKTGEQSTGTANEVEVPPQDFESAVEHEVNDDEVKAVINDLLDCLEKQVESPSDRESVENHQTDEVEELKKQMEALKREIKDLKAKPKFDIDEHKDNDESITFFTGFPSYDLMVFCFDLLKDKAANMSYTKSPRPNFDPNKRKPGSRRKLTMWQEFTMTCMRLRLGLLEKDLAERFRVSASTVSNICRTWIKLMRLELEAVCVQWPSKEQIAHYMPPLFKTFYPNLVSIIDCTEIQMESPSSLDKRSLCYSSYKSRTTMKSLIGITPNGVVSFCSDLYCGSISDPDIVRKSGYLQHIKRGDYVMADKGFTIRDDLAAVGGHLVLPHFLKAKQQFTKEEAEHNRKIASLRIHVERYMERLKNWHFFDRPIPISLSDIASDIWVVVACLSNFHPPMIY